MKRGFAASILAVAVLAAAPAYGHKLSLFATQEGAAITGRARYIPGGPASGMTIEVRDGAGSELTSLITNDDGRFTYDPSGHGGELVFVLATSDGHVAEARVTVGETSAAVPGGTDVAVLDEAIEAHLAPLKADLAAWQAEERRRDWIAAGGLAAGIAGAFLLARGRRATT